MRTNSCGQVNESTEGNTRGPHGPKKEGKPFYETENMVNFWLDSQPAKVYLKNIAGIASAKVQLL